jgi:hypothetical protein
VKPGDICCTRSTRYPGGSLVSQMTGNCSDDNPLVTRMKRKDLALVIAVSTIPNYPGAAFSSRIEVLVLVQQRLGWMLANELRVVE